MQGINVTFSRIATEEGGRNQGPSPGLPLTIVAPFLEASLFLKGIGLTYQLGPDTPPLGFWRGWKDVWLGMFQN